ncbi:MAG: hypothetical protein IJQ50_02210 [Clostridia bacterium]|nr:hypothetical protein [Clostridia bacterium]
MTYKESLDIAFLKTDSEESDYDSNMFPVLANEAQRFIAMYGTHINKKVSIDVTSAPYTYALPSDFYRMSLKGVVYAEDELQGADWSYADDGKIIINGTGSFNLYYYALPTDLTQPGVNLETYEYEVAPETHIAIPSYIGYQLVKTDDVQLAQVLLNEWNKYMSLFTDAQKAVKRRIKNIRR